MQPVHRQRPGGAEFVAPVGQQPQRDRSVTTADIAAALPEKGARRHYAENGLKSLFKVLKGRKLVFADPTRGMKTTPVATNLPLALDSAVIRGELNSPDPVVAFAVALVAFHALAGNRSESCGSPTSSTDDSSSATATSRSLLRPHPVGRLA